MRLLEHFQRWAEAMEDIEDYKGAEILRLQERIRVLEGLPSPVPANGKREKM